MHGKVAPVSSRDADTGGPGSVAYVVSWKSSITELRDMERRQLRLADVERTLERINVMEEADFLTRKQYSALPEEDRAVFDEFFVLHSRQRDRLKNAYSDPVVLRDAATLLESRWSQNHSNGRVPRDPVLVAVYGCTTNAPVDALLATRVIAGSFNGRGSVLVRCEEWFVDVLVDKIGSSRVFAASIAGVSDEDVGIAVGLWGEDRSSFLHHPASLMNVVRRIGALSPGRGGPSSGGCVLELLETVKGLSAEWSGTHEDLVNSAQRLSAKA